MNMEVGYKMIKSIHGNYIPATKYEAAAVVLIDLAWSEDQSDDLLKQEETFRKLTKVFNTAKAEELMKGDYPIQSALLELSAIAELGTPVEAIIDELSKINIDFDQFASAVYEQRIIQVTGSLARHELDDAIQYCCTEAKIVGPYDVPFYGTP